MSRPLISYFLYCYNQEAFIRDAVESAFAQTYSPLEIVISDDCSTDRTFEIIRAMTAAYSGPHSVRLNRNPANLGMGGNVSRSMDLCTGKLVVQADGDDISLPIRTEMIYQAWEQSERRATSIFSSYTSMAKDGTIGEVGGQRGDPGDSRFCWRLQGGLKGFLSTEKPVVNGCSNAWSPILFRYFGPLRSDLGDALLSFRTLSIGELYYINRPLVKYRRHGNNASFFPGRETMCFEHRERRLRWVDEQNVRLYESMLLDIQLLHQDGRITSAENEQLSAMATLLRKRFAVERQMMEGSIFERLLTLARTARGGNVRCALRFASRALPRPVYRLLYTLRQGLVGRSVFLRKRFLKD